jgi:hypothetical protein
MDDEATASLYLQMKDLAKRFVGKYEIGIAVEIRAFLAGKEDIQEFYESLDEDGYYFIDIYLKHFDIQDVTPTFLDLVCFLEYGDATLYTREIEEDVVHYLLASLTKDGLRFACKVNFSRYIERK